MSESPACPHCGDVEDYWPISELEEDGDESVLTCSGCGRDYKCTMEVDVSFDRLAQIKGMLGDGFNNGLVREAERIARMEAQ